MSSPTHVSGAAGPRSLPGCHPPGRVLVHVGGAPPSGGARKPPSPPKLAHPSTNLARPATKPPSHQEHISPPGQVYSHRRRAPRGVDQPFKTTSPPPPGRVVVHVGGASPLGGELDGLRGRQVALVQLGAAGGGARGGVFGGARANARTHAHKHARTHTNTLTHVARVCPSSSWDTRQGIERQPPARTPAPLAPYQPQTHAPTRARQHAGAQATTRSAGSPPGLCWP